MPENQLQRACRDRIRQAGGAVVTLNPANGAGQPDLLACVDGRAFAIELKQPGQRPSKLQRWRLGQWAAAGAIAAVVHSLDELDGLLALRPRPYTPIR